MGSHIAGLYFYDHPGTNNFIKGCAILIGTSGGYGDSGDDAEGGDGGGSIVGDGDSGVYGDGGGGGGG